MLREPCSNVCANIFLWCVAKFVLSTNTNNNTNPAVHSLNIIPTKSGNHTVNSFPSTLAQVAKV